MTRLRSRLAKTDVDRQVQGLVAAAERSVRNALGVCHRARTSGELPLGRVHRVQKDLGAVLGALENVGRVTPNWDGGDRDLMPEAERARQWRAARDAERAAEDAEALEPEPEPKPEPEPEPDASGGDS